MHNHKDQLGQGTALPESQDIASHTHTHILPVLQQ